MSTSAPTLKKKPIKDIIATFDQRAERYLEYVAKLEGRRFTTGTSLIDDQIRGVAPGELLLLIAYSGTFKSAQLQNWMLDGAHRTKLHHLMVSLEMPNAKLFEREIQMTNQVSGRLVESRFRGDLQQARRLMDTARMSGSQRVITCDEPRLTLSRIEEIVHYLQDQYDGLGAVGIDYLGLIKGGESKQMVERFAELSYGAKELAKSCDVPVTMLGQVNRQYASSKGVGIELDAAKGGGDVEAAADFAIGMFTCGEDVISRILKNRNGVAGNYYRMLIDKEALRFCGAEPWEPPAPEDASGYGRGRRQHQTTEDPF